MSKLRKRFLTIALALGMAAACLAPCAAAAGPFTITNPYEGVDWGTYEPYKAELHAHSTVSDGYVDFNLMVEAYYEKGYDVLAMTDHGVVDRGWVDLNVLPVMRFFQQIDKPSAFFPVSTGLTQQRFQEMSAGAGRSSGRIMLRVPFGIELNPTSLNKSHVNSWFSDWGNAYLGGSFEYEVAVRGVNGAGGLCAINHPSDTSGDDNLPLEEAYEGSRVSTVYKIQRLFEKYQALIGIEICNAHDRKLWDKLLTNIAPTGRNVLGSGTSDAHKIETIGNRFNWVLMEDNTVENLRESLAAGAFFAASRGTAGALEPVITEITAGAGKIAIEAENADAIRWISDGKEVATGVEIVLADCVGLGAYVRAEVQGAGGTLYTQPFLLSYDGMPAGKPVPGNYFDWGGILAFIRQCLLQPAALAYNWLMGLV